MDERLLDSFTCTYEQKQNVISQNVRRRYNVISNVPQRPSPAQARAARKMTNMKILTYHLPVKIPRRQRLPSRHVSTARGLDPWPVNFSSSNAPSFFSSKRNQKRGGRVLRARVR